MAVSKHNLWKRQKHGLMKLVRSHSEWLEKRREAKMHELGRKRAGDMPIESSQWWEKDALGGKPTTSISKGPYMADTPSSTKRTQVGKKI
jgi:hypothetical protein